LGPASEPAAHSYPEVFARNAGFSGAPQFGAPKGFGTGPLLYELALKPAVPVVSGVAEAALLASAPKAPPLERPKMLAVDERFLWVAAPVAGALLIFLFLLLPLRFLAGRRNSTALVQGRRANNAVVVDFATPEDGEMAIESALPAGELRDPGQRARQASAVREGLMPQLVRLMREKILQRLSSQRAHLIDSHVTGTMQVLELEERLEKIQSQFQARLAAREQRVAELEKELTAKDRFIRELLKAQSKAGARVSNE
ncbi:MAG: hypothetical protein QOF48_1082, partial [Verrucomicrobiota bacterium]